MIEAMNGQLGHIMDWDSTQTMMLQLTIEEREKERVKDNRER